MRTLSGLARRTSQLSVTLSAKPLIRQVQSSGVTCGIGFALIIGCFELGGLLGQRLAIPVPASVLGMAILLALLRLGIVRAAWIAPASGLLLLLLPALFVPLYVVALVQPAFWADEAWVFVPVAIVGGVLLLLAAARLACLLERR